MVVMALAAAFLLGRPSVSNAAWGHTCDIYASVATPCVAAHSTTRALFLDYNGPLYSVKRKSDGQKLDIGLLQKGGYADAASQESFCAGTTCIIDRIYDQTSRHNDLTIEGGGGRVHTPDMGAQADALPVTAGGHQVYGISFSGGIGYRNDHTSGVATLGKPETMYMVTSGTHVNGRCCHDYGNAETTNMDDHAGTMDAVNFSTACGGKLCRAGVPYVKADMEDGLFMSDDGISPSPGNQGQPYAYVTALLKNNGQNYFALKNADAQSPVLTTEYAGPEPGKKPGYSPMKQEGAIVLGTGGDNSNYSVGSFFEGVMTAGVSPDWADLLVQIDIFTVGYGGPTGLAGALAPGNQVSLKTSAPNAFDFLSHQDNDFADSTPPIVIKSLEPWSSPDDRRSATWIVRHGFAKPSCLSFESLNRPGAFLRHIGGALVTASVDGTAAFPGDSTFCPVSALAGRGKSLQAANTTGAYLRAYEGQVFVATDGGSQPYDTKTAFPQDASFVVTPPLGY